MKNLMMALLASSALAVSLPSLAQAHENEGGYGDNDWNNGGQTYDQFGQEYQHIIQSIQHGVSDGAYTRREASGFYREMQTIRARAYADQRNGYYDPEATQARLERFHARLHGAHERGHERQDYYQQNNYGYGDRQNGDRQYGGERQYGDDQRPNE